MKTPRSLFFPLAAIATALLSATGLFAIDSRVTAVTVYPDRALVERVAAIDISAGETSVVLPDLPANLWDASLQVRGSGPAGTRILDVQSRNVFVESTPTPEIKALEDQLQTLRVEKQHLDNEYGELSIEQGVLNKIIDATTTLPTEGDAPRPTMEQWSQLLVYAKENTARINAARLNLQQRESDLIEKIAAVEAQLNQARGRLPGRRAVKEVTVRVAATAAGTGQLNLSYTLPGARWAPVYTARLDSAARQVAFEYQAQVTNRTGERWENVALTLSTARPSAGGAAPDPRPWIVQLNRPRPDPGMTAMGVSAAPPALARAQTGDLLADASFGYAESKMVAEETIVETGLTAATFKITAPATIPADGTQQKVTVTTLTLPAGLRYDATPKLVPSAFLTATVANDSDFPLLAGQLAAFVDGAFIANSRLEQTMPGSDFDLALGVDEAVVIERTLVERFVEKTGFTNSGHRVTYEVKLELANHKSGPISLRLAEPLPVSRHEKIVVKLLEPTERHIATSEDSGAPFHRDDEGILTWNGSLAAGAQREIVLRFSIEHPADMPVDGVE